ncbi:NAD-dependent succinate-semialdehyde dehydrogenase [Haladaptatus halobius]|uniref:NAD-dependent succinate-semialdehyde dehydrogenase n=1 Tax=Haladaptatus halobius TaxID=2884875 RepID=UPI001D0AAB5E|nr:NAD-dependent succinate-semialdehyde dehydrogenase [Haladaptatus halobius]
MDRTNPATGNALEPIEDDTEEDIDAALDTASETFEAWRETSIGERQQLIGNAADVLRENKQEYAELMTREMGKPIAGAVSEIEKCVWACEYYEERADEFLQNELIGSAPETKTYVSYEPLGPVLAIMPWNFPMWQVFRFIAPHLTAGNVGLLKHASNVPGTAQAIEDVLLEAGYPEGVFQSLMIHSDQVEDIIRDYRLAAVTLTGSEGAGRAVAETAGSEIKKSVLELGGNDPFVVLDDADIETAAKVGAQARCQNNGQSCIAAKRFIVHEAIYDKFLDRFTKEMDALTVGDPMDEDTDVGPQARRDLMEDLHDQVQATIKDGATCDLGGKPLDRDGFYYPPTVLTDVPHDSASACEEVFGPSAAVFAVSGEAEAIELANDIDYGLGASVWTEDLDRGERVAHEFDAGMTYVNQLVKSDPRLPFGGVKDSGYGRELARHGIREFTNKKTIWVQSTDD